MTIFANIIGSDLRPHFKSFTRAQKLRGLKSGLKPGHFQQSKLSNNHLNTRIVNNKSHLQQCTITPSIRPGRWVGFNSTSVVINAPTENSLLQPSIPIEQHPFQHPSFLHISNSPSIQRQKGRSPSVSLSDRAVVRRRLTRPKIDLSKSFPFLHRNVAPNVGIGRLADNGQSPTTHRAAARNNILSYLELRLQGRKQRFSRGVSFGRVNTPSKRQERRNRHLQHHGGERHESWPRARIIERRGA